MMSSEADWSPLAKIYDPIKCGNIDGTSTDIHDKGIWRALNSTYRPNKGVTGDKHCTLFIGKLNLRTTEKSLREHMARYGKIVKIRVVRDLVTGYSKGYAFIEYSTELEANHAHNHANGIDIDGMSILVEREFARNMPGWIPRRMGGGFGGKKESGQLRFGCRLRPFKKPYIQLPQSRKLTESISRKHHASEGHRSRYREYSKVPASKRPEPYHGRDRYKR